MSETMLDNRQAKRGQIANNRQATSKHTLLALNAPLGDHSGAWIDTEPIQCRGDVA